MFRRAIVGAAVIACACAALSASAPPIGAATPDREAFASHVEAFARANQPAAGSRSGMARTSGVEASAPCIDKSYTDPVGDGALIDVESYSLSYTCSAKRWTASAVDSNSDTAASTENFGVFINRDRNPATGCGGFDRVVVAFWDEFDEIDAGAVNTPSCNQSTWTARSENIAVEFTAADTLGIAFAHSVINTSTFSWGMIWYDTGDNSDSMPNGPVHRVILPGVSTIQFSTIQYNSPGTDTGSNASLNTEWIGIRNYGPTTKNLKNYTVRDAQNNVYRFKTNFYLAADKAVKLHTGRGGNTSTDVYWGRTSYVWGNWSDNAILRSAEGATKDACSWTTPGSGSKACAT